MRLSKFRKLRIVFLLAAFLCAALGLCARRFGGALPSFLAAYAPDTLWAMLVYCGFGCFFGRKAIVHASCGLAFAFSIELSQLYHTPWLDTLRATTLGALVLGHGFLWTDLACYAVGIALCTAVECTLTRSDKAT